VDRAIIYIIVHALFSRSITTRATSSHQLAIIVNFYLFFIHVGYETSIKATEVVYIISQNYNTALSTLTFSAIHQKLNLMHCAKYMHV